RCPGAAPALRRRAAGGAARRCAAARLPLTPVRRGGMIRPPTLRMILTVIHNRQRGPLQRPDGCRRRRTSRPPRSPRRLRGSEHRLRPAIPPPRRIGHAALVLALATSLPAAAPAAEER